MTPTLSKTINVICIWIDQTPLSQAIQVTNWVVPVVQTVHILAIALVASSAIMINLRLIGLFWADRPLKAVAARFLPFVWWPMIVLLTTGAIMIISEPVRSLKNPAFQIKMPLVIAALIVTALVQSLIRRNPAFADKGVGRHGGATAIAVVSMLLWACIIFAGRWIAYYA
jgi:hypothetical protein